MRSRLFAGRSTPSSRAWSSDVRWESTGGGFPPEPPGNRERMRTVGSWAIIWIALGALWLLYQGEWNAIQIYAATSAAALSLVVAVLVRKHALPAARVERRWLVRVARIPWQVVREFGIVSAFLARALLGRRVPEGEFRALSFPAGGSRPADRGRRAFIALATGYSPNSYVLDVDEEKGLVLVHVLSPVPPGQELV